MRRVRLYPLVLKALIIERKVAPVQFNWLSLRQGCDDFYIGMFGNFNSVFENRILSRVPDNFFLMETFDRNLECNDPVLAVRNITQLASGKSNKKQP